MGTLLGGPEGPAEVGDNECAVASTLSAEEKNHKT